MRIEERAATIQDAYGANLALFLDKGGNGLPGYKKKVSLILVKDSVLPVLSKKSQITKHIVGFASAGWGNENTPPKAWSLEYIVAKNGYGPFLYDALLSYVKPNGLCSDRFFVSPAAQAVWKYYFSKRRDIRKERIDDMDNPATPPKNDDGKVHRPGEFGIQSSEAAEPLNYIYFSSESFGAYTKLLLNGTHLDTLAKAHGVDNLAERLREAGEAWFHSVE